MHYLKLLAQMTGMMLAIVFLVGCGRPVDKSGLGYSTATPDQGPPTPTSAHGIGRTKRSEVDGMVMVFVPAGEFTMGSLESDSEAWDDEKPQHRVYLEAYWIDQTEVTNAMYARCVEAQKCSVAIPRENELRDLPRHPVRGIAWTEATEYCHWAGRRLPTEAEWEKGARGADGRRYPWGNTPPNAQLANFDSLTGGLSEVGSFPDGASPYGALDMAGNAWEWVSDWYDETYYSNSPYRQPVGPLQGTNIRVLRGGAWNTVSRAVRAANRFWAYPYRNDYDGFRCASNAAPEELEAE